MRVNRSIAALLLLCATLAPSARAGEKLKGFYSGSGGISAEVHRVLIIEFAADGTAILQQKWHDKDPQTWHARWKQENKKVTLIYYTAKESKDSKDAPLPEPLIFDFKHGTLTPVSWDAPTLGYTGPPKLTPFGGTNAQAGSVAGCRDLNILDPTRECVTWGSNH